MEHSEQTQSPEAESLIKKLNIILVGFSVVVIVSCVNKVISKEEVTPTPEDVQPARTPQPPAPSALPRATQPSATPQKEETLPPKDDGRVLTA